MDDENKSTRLISCRVLTRTFDTLGRALDQDRLHNMYPELLKRLDDSSDEIRVMVTQTMLAYLDCFREDYEVGLYRAHLEALYKGLLVHLDDPEAKIQEAVLSEFDFYLCVEGGGGGGGTIAKFIGIWANFLVFSRVDHVWSWNGWLAQ